MTVTRKDVAATALTALVVLVFIATHEGWDVPLIGDSHRWAAAAITLIGAVTCGLGSAEHGVFDVMLAQRALQREGIGEAEVADQLP